MAKDAGEPLAFPVTLGNAHTTKNLRETTNFTIRDCPPGNPKLIDTAIAAADVAIVPVQPSGIKTERMWDTIDIAGTVKAVDLLTSVLLSATSTSALEKRSRKTTSKRSEGQSRAARKSAAGTGEPLQACSTATRALRCRLSRQSVSNPFSRRTNRTKPFTAQDAPQARRTPNKKLTILMDPTLHKRLHMQALSEDRTMTDIITTLVSEYLEANAPEGSS